MAHILSASLVKRKVNLDSLIEKFDGHIKTTLIFLRNNKEAHILLNRFKLPVANSYIERLVRESIKLGTKEKLTDDHLKQAILSALLYPLRQAIGSCFATAPAIYIQNEQKERLLIDLYDLIMLCQLKRTFAGKENIVPINPTWNYSEQDHPLLRMWEYTLASFSDYKSEFSKWNFYKSLGLNPEEKDGLGSFLYHALQDKLDMSNKETETRYQDYSRAVDEVRVAQTLLKQADTFERARMRKVELEIHAIHARTCENLYQNAYERSKHLSTFFSFLINKYIEQFQQYFLEIFDAHIVQSYSPIYEDSPAGFRLVCKHGRSNPLTWTSIHDAEGYIQALIQFFTAVEPYLIAECDWKEGKQIIQDLTTSIVHHTQTDDFLSFATRNNTPWSYISGGNMEKLLQCYYCIEGNLTKEERAMENPLDLLIFLLDLMKALPYSTSKRFEEDHTRSLFIYSPIHAFLFKPGFHPFIKGWLDRGFTYTWVRDNIILPGKKIYTSLYIDKAKQMELGTKLLGHHFSPYQKALNLPDFRTLLIELSPDQEEKIDTLLFNTFPRPKPLLFADTNWLNYFFAFAVNPATFELDLYRYDPLTNTGIPMTIWKEQWNKVWGVLTCPAETKGTDLPDIANKLKRV